MEPIDPFEKRNTHLSTGTHGGGGRSRRTHISKPAFSTMQTQNSLSLPLPNFGPDDEEEDELNDERQEHTTETEELDMKEAAAADVDGVSPDTVSFSAPRGLDETDTRSLASRRSRFGSDLTGILSSHTSLQDVDEATEILERDMALGINNYTNNFMNQHGQGRELVYEVPADKASAFIQATENLNYDITDVELQSLDKPVVPVRPKRQKKRSKQKKSKKGKRKRKKRKGGLLDDDNFCAIMCFLSCLFIILLGVCLYLFAPEVIEDLLGLGNNSTASPQNNTLPATALRADSQS
eukprot:augustus_masked-scaffold_1-processed-gene-29.58-mRNA-1 protein AED:1.00 eAED:1.00 QI:0/-1/0/0/-1/1/1/0/294